jgi:ABC-2 type transport system permease protein
MRYLRLIGRFIRASLQQELAYRSNFYIAILHSLLGLGTGVLGVLVLFGQIEQVRGWDMAGALVLLGVYLTVEALRRLFIGPGLDSLAGMDGDVWTGGLDFTMLRPLNTQFMVTFRQWRFLALFDLALGVGVIASAVARSGQSVTTGQMLSFAVALGAGIVVLYAILLAFTAVIFWSPGLLLTWVFGGIMQMARYPVGLYPGGLRLLLTWVVPVGLITTVPAEALTGRLAPGMLAGSVALALALLVGASALFQIGLRRYASASS